MGDEDQGTGLRIERAVREGVAALLLIATGLILAAHYSRLPKMIHSPFNGGADVNGMADKSQLWLLVFIQAFLYALMSLFNLFPDTGVTYSAPSMQQFRPMMLARIGMGWIKALVMFLVLLWMLNLVS